MSEKAGRCHRSLCFNRESWERARLEVSLCIWGAFDYIHCLFLPLWNLYFNFQGKIWYRWNEQGPMEVGKPESMGLPIQTLKSLCSSSCTWGRYSTPTNTHFKIMSWIWWLKFIDSEIRIVFWIVLKGVNLKLLKIGFCIFLSAMDHVHSHARPEFRVGPTLFSTGTQIENLTQFS